MNFVQNKSLESEMKGQNYQQYQIQHQQQQALTMNQGKETIYGKTLAPINSLQGDSSEFRILCVK